MLPLLRAADGSLHFDGSVAHYLLGLDSNLLSQFTGRRDDQGADVADRGSVAVPSFEVGVAQDALDDGQQEGQGLASARSGLSDHVAAVETVVQGHLLDLGHGGDVHPLGDGVDDSRRDDAVLGKFVEPGELGRSLVAVLHRRWRFRSGLLQTRVHGRERPRCLYCTCRRREEGCFEWGSGDTSRRRGCGGVECSQSSGCSSSGGYHRQWISNVQQKQLKNDYRSVAMMKNAQQEGRKSMCWPR